MNENVYSVENYSTYPQQINYSKQPHTVTEIQTYFSYPSTGLNNFSPNSNYVDGCTTNIGQNVSRNQHNSSNNYQEPTDILTWENRTMHDLEKNMKFSDKMEMIEITSKDLSPASYCSNIDLLVPELYNKNTPNKEVQSINKYDNQYYYNQNSCTQKSYDYSACSQFERSKYCTQKNYEPDFFKSCNYVTSENTTNINCTTKNNYKTYIDNYLDHNIYNYYEKSQDTPDIFNNASNLQLDPIVNSIDQQTEDSNDDSDIIVEESDEEVGSCEDQDKRYPYLRSHKCLICNLVYTPFGIQFYFLTSKSPLTMSTQKPVLNKITELIGSIATTRNFLCSECLGLLNTIDHLQLKLSTFSVEFVNKYKKTCADNNIVFHDVEDNKTKNKTRTKYKCKYCSKILCLRKYFVHHLKKHKQNTFLCEYCGRIFNSRKIFTIHKRQHFKIKVQVSQKLEPFKCNNCSQYFRTHTQLKCHLNYCLGIFPFECKIHNCDKKFATKTKLKYHIKLKHDKKFTAICAICNIGFIKMSDYKNHKITHTTEKKYCCTKCDRSYKTISNLRFHMKIHDEVLPFTCNICKKGFMRKEYYDTHINKHKGIRNYECPICKKSFMSQKSLDAHSKYHEDSKKITCNICGKIMVNGFKDHLRVHNNLKEFECEYCDEKFNTRGTLNKHIKKKHTAESHKKMKLSL